MGKLTEQSNEVVSPPHRVLLDLSFATLGYSGIPQEVRLQLKSFFETPGIAPTGLLYGRQDSVLNHRFVKNDVLASHFENSSLFIEALAAGKMTFSDFRLVRLFQHASRLWHVLLRRHIKTRELDLDLFWDFVWRRLLSVSLSDENRQLASECPMLMANLGGMMIAARPLYGLPSVKLNTQEFDAVIFHDAQAVRVSPGTCKLIRFHDLIPGLRPDLVGSRRAIKIHFRSIRRCLDDSIFVCSSEPTREDLLRAFPEIRERTTVIPIVMGESYFPERRPESIAGIINSRRVRYEGASCEIVVEPNYILMTSTLEPRKNHLSVLRAFEEFETRHQTGAKLVLIGNKGWKGEEIVRAIRSLVRRGLAIHLEQVPIEESRLLCNHARALVFASFYEGFGYPPVEAMCCGTPVILSDISSHRWVCGDAALYFDPYSIDSLREAFEKLLIHQPALAGQLTTRGTERTRLYQPSVVSSQWLTLLNELRRQGITSNVRDARLANLDLAEMARQSSC